MEADIIGQAIFLMGKCFSVYYYFSRVFLYEPEFVDESIFFKHCPHSKRKGAPCYQYRTIRIYPTPRLCWQGSFHSWNTFCNEFSLGIDSNRIINNCVYNSNLSGGCYPPEGIARLCGLCCNSKISIDPRDMVKIKGFYGRWNVLIYRVLPFQKGLTTYKMPRRNGCILQWPTGSIRSSYSRFKSWKKKIS